MHKPEKAIETCIACLRRMGADSYHERSRRDAARILELAGDAYFELRHYSKAANAYSRSYLEKPDRVLDEVIRNKIASAKRAQADREQTPEPLRPPLLVSSVPCLPPLPMRPGEDFTKESQLVPSDSDPQAVWSGFRLATYIARCIGVLLVRLADHVFFFGLGKAYFNRFAIYAADASNAKAWREDQQGEWDRLATGVSGTRQHDLGDGCSFSPSYT